MAYLIGYGLVILGFADFGLSLFGIDIWSAFSLPAIVSKFTPMMEGIAGYAIIGMAGKSEEDTPAKSDNE